MKTGPGARGSSDRFRPSGRRLVGAGGRGVGPGGAPAAAQRRGRTTWRREETPAEWGSLPRRGDPGPRGGARGWVGEPRSSLYRRLKGGIRWDGRGFAPVAQLIRGLSTRARDYVRRRGQRAENPVPRRSKLPSKKVTARQYAPKLLSLRPPRRTPQTDLAYGLGPQAPEVPTQQTAAKRSDDTRLFAAGSENQRTWLRGSGTIAVGIATTPIPAALFGSLREQSAAPKFSLRVQHAHLPSF